MEPQIYHFKILVPSAAAGAIIGKGGITIAQLQKDAGARVKMSKASEFYPGTTERVCLVSGPVEGILKIHDFIMEKISEKPPSSSSASSSPISSATSSLESSTESTSQLTNHFSSWSPLPASTNILASNASNSSSSNSKSSSFSSSSSSTTTSSLSSLSSTSSSSPASPQQQQSSNMILGGPQTTPTTPTTIAQSQQSIANGTNTISSADDTTTTTTTTTSIKQTPVATNDVAPTTPTTTQTLTPTSTTTNSNHQDINNNNNNNDINTNSNTINLTKQQPLGSSSPTSTLLLNQQLHEIRREKQVKILIPNSTAGMIIGKGGSYIKQIKEESGAYVQISQKSVDVALPERCVTVIGDLENNRKACSMILSKIVEDIGSGNCLNINYSDVSGPVANFNPTGSPYANTTHSNSFSSSSVPFNISTTTTNNNNNKGNHHVSNGATTNHTLNINQHHLQSQQNINITSNNGIVGAIQPPSSLQSNGTGGVLSGSITGIAPPVKLATPPLAAKPIGLANLSSSIPASVNSAQMIESIKTMLRISGYGEDAVSEITSAVSTLASYGVLSILGVLGLI